MGKGRTPKVRFAMPIDLDDRNTRRDFLRTWKGSNVPDPTLRGTRAWAYATFPARPRAYVRHACMLWNIALEIERGQPYMHIYELMDAAWQWRRFINVKTCVVKGKNFRAKPPRRKNLSAWLKEGKESRQ